MSDKASIIINSSQNGNDKSMSVGYVNPNATPSELIQFAQGINSLTQNVYRGTTLVEKTELVVKPEHPAVMYSATMTAADIKSADDQNDGFFNEFMAAQGSDQYFNFDANSLPRIVSNSTIFSARILKNSSSTFLTVCYDARIASRLIEAGETVYDSSGVEVTAARETGEIVVQLPETTQYAAKTLTITVTA